MFSYGDLGERVWITPGTPAHNALKAIIMDKRLLNDLKYFIKFKHTGNLEVFHSVLLKYCPKKVQSCVGPETMLSFLFPNSLIYEQLYKPRNYGKVPRY